MAPYACACFAAMAPVPAIPTFICVSPFPFAQLLAETGLLRIGFYEDSFFTSSATCFACLGVI